MARIARWFLCQAVFSLGAATIAQGQMEGRAWVAAGAHPWPHYQSDPVEHNGVLYSVGGWSGSPPGPIVTYTWIGRLDANGNITASETGPVFPRPDQGPGLTVAHHHLFAAGWDGIMYRARILNDGTLNPWEDLGGVGGGAVGNGRGGRLAVEAYADRLYVSGGWTGSDILDEVWMTTVDPDGNIGAWSELTRLPSARQHHSVHFINRRMYVLGGITGGLAISSSVHSAPVHPDGTLGQWRPEAALPHPLWYHNSVVVGQDIYLLGGRRNYSGSEFNVTVYRGSASPADGRILSWSLAGQVPLDQSDGPGAVHVPSMRTTYLVGGRNPASASVTGVVRRDKACYADCNGDGVLNIADFGCFQSKFALGCP